MAINYLLGIPVSRSEQEKLKNSFLNQLSKDEFRVLLTDALRNFGNKAGAALQFSGVGAGVIAFVATKNAPAIIGIAAMIVGSLLFIAVSWVSWGRADIYDNIDVRIDRLFKLAMQRSLLINLGLVLSAGGLLLAILGELAYR